MYKLATYCVQCTEEAGFPEIALATSEREGMAVTCIIFTHARLARSRIVAYRNLWNSWRFWLWK
jgi:hypothetical protein